MGVAERWVNMRCNLIKLTDNDNPSDNADMSNEKGVRCNNSPSPKAYGIL